MSAQPIAGSQPFDRVELAIRLGTSLAAWLPRSQQQVLGWLMVCTPAEQTQADIRDALGLSSGAVSSALRWLVDVSLVERVGPSGDRTARYLVPAGAWTKALERGLEMMASSIGSIEQSVPQLEAAGDDRAARNVTEVVAYYEESVAVLRELVTRLRSSEPGACDI